MLRAVVRRCAVNKVFLKNSGKHFSYPNFIKKETVAQVLSCEFCEHFKITFSTEDLRWLVLKCNISVTETTAKIFFWNFLVSKPWVNSLLTRKEQPAVLLEHELYHSCLPMNFFGILQKSFFIENVQANIWT